VKAGLLREGLGRDLPSDARILARALKALPVHVTSPRPIAEAISTAGGLAWPELTPELMIRAIPGWFAAGEMLDWEVTTGGYLLTACFASGRWAGLAAARALSS
jgi:predicted flavoprotein YhiN